MVPSRVSTSNRRGSTLPVVLVVGALSMTVAVGTLKLLSLNSGLHRRDIVRMQTFWTNQGAVRLAVRYLTISDPIPDVSIMDFAGATGISLNGMTPEQVVIALTGNPANKDYFTVSSTCRTQGYPDNVTRFADVHPVQFPYYTQCIDSGMREFEAWENDYVAGNYHTNSPLRVADNAPGRIMVNGRTSAAGRFNPASSVDFLSYGIMRCNYRTGIARVTDGSDMVPDDDGNDVAVKVAVDDDINGPPPGWFEQRFPWYKAVSLRDIDHLHPANGLYDGGYKVPDKHLIFKVDISGLPILLTLKGKDVEIKRAYSMPDGELGLMYLGTMSVQDIRNDYKGIILCDNLTSVKGRLNGMLTIVAEKDKEISVGGPIVYADPDTDPSDGTFSDDCLALVSGKNIVFRTMTDGDPLYDSGSCPIHACLFAPRGRFAIAEPDKWAKDSADFPVNLVGSVVAALPGKFNKGKKEKITVTYDPDRRFETNAVHLKPFPYVREEDAERPGEQQWVLAGGIWSNGVQ